MPIPIGMLSILGGVGQGLQAQNAQAIDKLRAIYGYMGKVDPATIRAQQQGIDANIQGQYRDQYGNIIAGGRTDVANIDQNGLNQRSPYLQGDPNGSQISPYTQSIMQLRGAQGNQANGNAGVDTSKILSMVATLSPQSQPGALQSIDSQLGTNLYQHFTGPDGKFIPVVDPMSQAKIGLLGSQQNLNGDIGSMDNAKKNGLLINNQWTPQLDQSLIGLRANQGQGDLMSGQGNLDRGQAAQTTAATGQARLNQLAPLYASEVGVNQARMKNLLTKDPDFAYQTTMFDNINSNITKVQSNYQSALSQGDSAAAANWNQQLQYLNGQRQQLADTLKARAAQNGSGGQQQTLGTPPPGSNPNMPSVSQIQPLQPPVRNVQAQNAGQPPQGFVPLPGAKVGGVYVDPSTKTYWYKGQSYNLAK